MDATKNLLCPCCGEGRLHSLRQDYIARIEEGQTVKVPNIYMEVCDKCGEKILSLEAAREVDSALAEYTDRLLTDELTDIRETFEVDKTEMSETLGLGRKTYLRWEQGKQYPSRSMGYYLRVLREFPEAFEWLRSRGWRGKNRVMGNETSPILEVQSRFPALAGNLSRLNSLATDRRNYAMVLFDRT